MSRMTALLLLLVGCASNDPHCVSLKCLKEEAHRERVASYKEQLCLKAYLTTRNTRPTNDIWVRYGNGYIRCGVNSYFKAKEILRNERQESKSN